MGLSDERDDFEAWLAGWLNARRKLSFTSVTAARLHAAMRAGRQAEARARSDAYTEALQAGCDANGAQDCSTDDDDGEFEAAFFRAVRESLESDAAVARAQRPAEGEG